MLVHWVHGFTVMMRLREVEDEVGRLGRGILDLLLLMEDLDLAVSGLLADSSWGGHGLMDYRSHLIDDSVCAVAPRGHGDIYVLEDSLSDT